MCFVDNIPLKPYRFGVFNGIMLFLETCCIKKLITQLKASSEYGNFIGFSEKTV